MHKELGPDASALAWGFPNQFQLPTLGIAESAHFSA